MRHRRAQIDEAIIETFKPLEIWNPQLAYKAKARRLYQGLSYLALVDIPAPVNVETRPNLPPPEDTDRWLQVSSDTDPVLFGFKTVIRQFTPWISLKKQGAIPALMLVPGDNGSKPNSPAAGFIDERYPVNVQIVLEEERPAVGQDPYFLIDQVSDAHYSVEKQWKSNHILSVEDVQAEGTRIEGWRNSEEHLYPILIVQFRIIVVHRYRATSAV